MNFKKKLTLVVAVGFVGAGSAFAATVYEVPAGANEYYSTSLEYGDQVTLGGVSPEWVLQSVTFPYYSNFDGPGGLTVKIYANDGVSGAPNSVLYSSTPIDIVSNGGNGSVVTIPFAYSTANTIPSSFGFTYTVQFAGVGGNNAAGLFVPNLAPTVGSSLNDYWEKGAGGWETRTIVGGDLANFQISITAVPEPSVVALAGLGLAGLLGLAVRGSRKS